ncbi:MAG: hypothetical protein CM15mP128_0230 [Methanobacteriota archaeon]|nr:MAG: hypothetical protein CM15mP128_0230 [Euryarchaeota archaeon]
MVMLFWSKHSHQGTPLTVGINCRPGGLAGPHPCKSTWGVGALNPPVEAIPHEERGPFRCAIPPLMNGLSSMARARSKKRGSSRPRTRFPRGKGAIESLGRPGPQTIPTGTGRGNGAPCGSCERKSRRGPFQNGPVRCSTSAWATNGPSQSRCSMAAGQVNHQRARRGHGDELTGKRVPHLLSTKFTEPGGALDPATMAGTPASFPWSTSRVSRQITLLARRT